MPNSLWKILANAIVSGFFLLRSDEIYPLLPINPTRSLFFKPFSCIFTFIASIGSGIGMVK